MYDTSRIISSMPDRVASHARFAGRVHHRPIDPPTHHHLPLRHHLPLLSLAAASFLCHPECIRRTWRRPLPA